MNLAIDMRNVAAPAEAAPPVAMASSERQMVDARAERLEALGRGAAQIVHELNLPASLISGSLENLEQHVAVLIRGARAACPSHESDDRTGDAALAYAIEHAPDVLRICRDGVERLARLVGELRTLVRGEAAASTPAPVDLARILADVVSTLALARRDSRAPLVQVRRDAVTTSLVLGCAGLLERALTNLVANAFDAVRGSADPRIWIDLTDAPRSSGNGAASFLEVTIRDNGPGIPPTHREQVFDAFFTTKRQGGGMGLGLAIARDIVVAHGGKIGVREGPSPGATFFVRLPRTHAP